jgi:hypothetical protein
MDSQIAKEHLNSKPWLLAYDASAPGWLAQADGNEFLAADPFFSIMSSVSQYSPVRGSNPFVLASGALGLFHHEQRQSIECRDAAPSRAIIGTYLGFRGETCGR